MFNKITTGIFAIGILMTAYAALAFFVWKSLPPNVDNRLPSLCLLAAGMATMFVGVALRGFK